MRGSFLGWFLTISSLIQGSSKIKSIDSGELIQAEPDAVCSI